MARMKLLLIIVSLAFSVHAQFDNRPRYQFTVPLPPPPPIPVFGPIPPNGRLPIVIPSLNTIKNTIPGPGQVYNGVFAQSTSSLVRDKDGKLVPSGETYVLTNNNGKVDEYRQFRG